MNFNEWYFSDLINNTTIEFNTFLAYYVELTFWKISWKGSNYQKYMRTMEFDSLDAA